MLVRDVEKIFQNLNKYPFSFDHQTISECSFIHLCRHLEKKKKYHILTLGSIQSIFFWKEANDLDYLDVSLYAIEHDENVAKNILAFTQDTKKIHITISKLKQISNDDWEVIHKEPSQSLSRWPSIGESVTKDLYNFYTIHNTFYEDINHLSTVTSFDIMILDGPHGNGRSLSFPLFSNILNPNAWVIIDDFDHYPFLHDLGNIYYYKEVFREKQNRSWVLLQLKGLRNSYHS